MTRKELNKLYDANRIWLSQSACWSINSSMQAWQHSHPWATTEQYNKALKRKTVDLCLECPFCFSIKEAEV